MPSFVKNFVSFSELSGKKFFVGLSRDFNEELISLLVEKYGSVQKASFNLNLKWVSVYNWKRKSQYPLFYLRLIMEDLCLNDNLLAEKSVFLRTGFNWETKGGSLSKSISPKFPIVLSKGLARIIANIFGDGVLSIDRNGAINMTYYNQSEVLRSRFKKDVRDVFGDVEFGEGVNKETPYVRVPTPVACILLLRVNSFDSKSADFPCFIKTSDEEIKKAFLRAFFDDESHVRYSPPERKIELSLSNLSFLKEIKDLLEEFEINTTKIYSKLQRGFRSYYFYIYNFHNLKNYNDAIGFSHPKKLEEMSKIMANPGRKSYACGETCKKILGLLNEKLYTSSDLSEVLERDRSTVNYWLGKLFSQGKVYKVKVRKLKYGREILWGVKA